MVRDSFPVSEVACQWGIMAYLEYGYMGCSTRDINVILEPEYLSFDQELWVRLD